MAWKHSAGNGRQTRWWNHRYTMTCAERGRRRAKSNGGREGRREAVREAEGGGAVKNPSPALRTQWGAASTSSCSRGPRRRQPGDSDSEAEWWLNGLHSRSQEAVQHIPPAALPDLSVPEPGAEAEPPDSGQRLPGCSWIVFPVEPACSPSGHGGLSPEVCWRPYEESLGERLCMQRVLTSHLGYV